MDFKIDCCDNRCESIDKYDCDDCKEAEGVWSSDIETSFNEALLLYPPCGRRKIVLSEEGKMFGRNELIARYIKMQTGKSRSRKQVSSHIQVLARRKCKDIQSHIQEKGNREQARQQLASMTSAQIVSDCKLNSNLSLCVDSHKSSTLIKHSVSSFTNTQGLSKLSPVQYPSTPPDTASFIPRQTQNAHLLSSNNNRSSIHRSNESPPDLIDNNNYMIPNQWAVPNMSPPPPPPPQSDMYLQEQYRSEVGRSIATQKMRLLELSVYLEADEFSIKIERDYQVRNYWSHVFASLVSSTTNSPYLESIDICQIWDKYPEFDGLKEYFEKGPEYAFFMVKFWIDVNIEVYPQSNQAWTIIFEGVENIQIKLSTKLCSFGRQFLERIEEKDPSFENGAFIYRFENESMCDYMKKFIVKLSSLEERSMMNSVLENFTILQTVINAFTGEILLCIAFAMEVSMADQGSQYHIYKLIRHPNFVPLNNI